MSNYVKIAGEAGDRYLAALEQGQENFLKYIAAMNAWTPRPPGMPVETSGLQAFSDAGFEFSEKLLQQQKSFSDKLFAQSAKPASAARKPAKVASIAAPAKAEAAPQSRAAKPRAKAATKPAKAPVVRSSKKKAAARAKPKPTDKS